MLLEKYWDFFYFEIVNKCYSLNLIKNSIFAEIKK